jgi:hypothetical protein
MPYVPKFWSAKWLKWPKAIRAHVPRHRGRTHKSNYSFPPELSDMAEAGVHESVRRQRDKSDSSQRKLISRFLDKA